MPRIDIPKRNKFLQVNKGNVLGSIWATKSIDPVYNEQKINISPIMGYSTNEDDESDLDSSIAGFTFTSAFGIDAYYAVGAGRVWTNGDTDPDDTWSIVNHVKTDYDINSDIVAFNSNIYIASPNNFRSYDGSTFTDVDTLASNPHSFAIYQNRIYVSDLTDQIHSMASGGSSLTKPNNSHAFDVKEATGVAQLITKIVAVSNGIWIGTVYTDKAGGEAIFWDGQTQNTYDVRHILPRGVLAMEVFDDIPYITDSLGRLRALSSTTFKEIARLPIKNEEHWQFNSNSNDRWIHPNGMEKVGDEIYTLVANRRHDSDEDEIEQMPSGIWAFNQKYGLYHKYSFADYDIRTGTVSDFGTSNLREVGALFNSNATGGSTVDRTEQSDVIAGLQYYSDATTEKAAICATDVNNSIRKGGYFVTTQIQANEFDEAWKEVIALYDYLSSSDNRIILKYRTSEDTPVYSTGTWDDDLTIRSSSDLSTVENYNELEILRGNGSGYCYTIKSISGSYRISLRENVLSSMSGTIKFRTQKWKEIGNTSETAKQILRRTIGDSNIWIQIKIFMIGTGESPQLNRLIVSSENRANYK